ncbi:MAG: hypothetical protein ACYC7H_14345, partial [Chloroflexota bacterium]
RALIQRSVAAGADPLRTSRLMDCLARLLRVQASLTGANGRQLDQALANALDAIAAELGITL